MSFTRPLDYLALYRMRPERHPRPGHLTVPAGIDLFGETGTVCSASSDAPACSARVKKLVVRNAQCVPDGPWCTPFVVTTVGDEVRRIDDRRALVELLGAIDSPEKAVIAAWWAGLDLRCWTHDYGARVKYAEDWYVRSEWSGCGGRAMRTLRIDRAGNVVSDTTEEPPLDSGVTCEY